MKLIRFLITAITLSFLALPFQAMAVTYNNNITAIFGSGNPNTGWVVDSAGGVTLGLRLKDRTNGDTTNVNGVYSYATPLAAVNRAIYNWEFSISTGNTPLAQSGYDFYVAFDTDNSAGTSMTAILLSALVPAINDNAYGTAGVTGNGAGTVGTYATLGGTNNLMQNSENDAFFGVNYTALDATRNYSLFAVASGAGEFGTRVASVDAVGIIGRGGAAAVPEGGATIAMLGMGLFSLGLMHYRRPRQSHSPALQAA